MLNVGILVGFDCQLDTTGVKLFEKETSAQGLSRLDWPYWPTASLWGVVLMSKWCGTAQPTVGGTIPYAGGPGLYKKKLGKYKPLRNPAINISPWFLLYIHPLIPVLISLKGRQWPGSVSQRNMLLSWSKCCITTVAQKKSEHVEKMSKGVEGVHVFTAFPKMQKKKNQPTLKSNRARCDGICLYFCMTVYMYSCMSVYTYSQS